MPSCITQLLGSSTSVSPCKHLIGAIMYFISFHTAYCMHTYCILLRCRHALLSFYAAPHAHFHVLAGALSNNSPQLLRSSTCILPHDRLYTLKQLTSASTQVSFQKMSVMYNGHCNQAKAMLKCARWRTMYVLHWERMYTTRTW